MDDVGLLGADKRQQYVGGMLESLEPGSTARSYGWVEIVGLDLDPPKPLSVRAL